MNFPQAGKSQAKTMEKVSLLIEIGKTGFRERAEEGLVGEQPFTGSPHLNVRRGATALKKAGWVQGVHGILAPITRHPERRSQLQRFLVVRVRYAMLCCLHRVGSVVVLKV